MIQLPKAHEVARYLTKLLRRDVTAQDLRAPATLAVIGAGSYHTGNGVEFGRCGADLALAAYSGAALSMIPADAAQECVQRRCLDDNLQENFAEILNVMTRLFVPPEGMRVALLHTLPAGTWTPVASNQRLHFQVEIAGYGHGILAFERTPS